MRKFVFLLLCCVSLQAAEYKIFVEGMHCVLCTNLVRKAILKVDGVISAKATLKGKLAIVQCEDSTDKEKLLEAIETTGYEGVFVEWNAILTKKCFWAVVEVRKR